MIYRSLAGESVSQLGFGMMRLPTVGGRLDQPAVDALVHRAMDQGLNYLDTAWVYHGGLSEDCVAQTLTGGRRDQVFIADKSPVWLVQSPADFPRLLDEQLGRLKTDRIDFYLLHALNRGSWQTCLTHGALEFLEKARAAGKIRHFGFSYHDDAEFFLPILQAYPWEFCQIQYNYLDRGLQAGEAGLRAARAQGTDVIVMEPLRGGNLAGSVPAAVQKLWDRAAVRRSAAEWALRWVWNEPGVATVLSGMGTAAQVEENLALAADARPGALTADELALVDEVERAYRTLIAVGCTGCRYCLPCPHGVDIPRNFGVYNEWSMFDRTALARGGYQWIPQDQRADRCVACGVCVEACPQRLDIPSLLSSVVRDLA